MSLTLGLLPGPGEVDDPRRPTEPSPAPVLYAVLRFWRSVVAAACLGGLVGLCGGLMRPNQYTSSGTLLLRSGARESETAESAVAGRDARDPRPFDVIANEIEILSHRDTFRRVVERVGVGRVLEVYDPAAEDTPETSFLSRGLHGLQTWWFANVSTPTSAATPQRREHLALETLMKRLDLAPAGGSLIRVSYEAHTPQLAKEITDAFLASAEEHHRHVFSNRTSLDFLTNVERQTREAAIAASRVLQEFKQQHDVFDLAFQRTRVLTDIVALQAQITAGEEELRACLQRCATLREMLASERPTVEFVSDTAPMPSPEFVALQQQLFTLRTQEVTLRGTANDVPEMNRSLAALAAHIAEVEGRLREVPPTLPGPKSRQSVANPRYERLRTQLDLDEPKAAELAVANEQRSSRLGKLQSRLEEFETIGARHDALVEDVRRHEADSKRFLESREKIELLNLLDEHKLSNLAILEAGDVPMQKSGPKRGMWAIGGVAMGCVLGLCLALVRHRFDGSVRRSQDLDSLGVEVLGVVPELKKGAQLGPGSGGNAEDIALRRRLNGAWGALVPAPRSRDTCTTIAMVGDGNAAGVTTLALHFAERFARSLHLEVLLVEANYHHPTLAGRLGLDRTAAGFADLVAGSAACRDVVRATAVRGLKVVCAGALGAGRGVLAGPPPEEVLRTLAAGHRIVILDLPSIVDHPEFRPYAALADTVVPVFGAGRSTKGSVQGLCHAIEGAGRRTAGAILNRWRSVRPFWMPRSVDL